MNDNEARVLLDRVLKMATADNTELFLSGSNEASTRFANNAITQNIVRTDSQLVIKSSFGNRVGTVRVNRFDDDALREAVKRSEDIAKLSEPDPEYVGPVEPSEYVVVDSWDDATNEASPEERAVLIQSAVAKAEAVGQNTAGSYATEGGYGVVANSKGLFASHRSTSARFIITAMTSDSSGWAESAHWKAGEVDALGAAERAVEKAKTASPPQPIEPGRYTVIMEPAALAEMLAFMVFSMDAKSADEGTSCFSSKLGTKIAGENITISSSPDDTRCPGSPFFGDGMPVPSVTWIDKGVVSELARSRFWSGKTGLPFTGRPTNLIMSGGNTSVDEMVASTETGILITRFWYIRFVDPMKLLLTGMTRDGLFLIKDGKIAQGLKNMRFNDSPFSVLSNTAAMGEPQFLGGYYNALIPAIKVDGFTFSSGTRF